MQREFVPLQSPRLVSTITAMRNTVINSTSPPGDRHLSPPPLYWKGLQGRTWWCWSFVICRGKLLRSIRPKVLCATGNHFLEDLRKCFAPVSHAFNSPMQWLVGIQTDMTETDGYWIDPLFRCDTFKSLLFSVSQSAGPLILTSNLAEHPCGVYILKGIATF